MLTGDAIAIAKETCKMLALGTKVYNSDKLIHGGLSGTTQHYLDYSACCGILHELLQNADNTGASRGVSLWPGILEIAAIPVKTKLLSVKLKLRQAYILRRLATIHH
jgi:hypothetical protein